MRAKPCDCTKFVSSKSNHPTKLQRSTNQPIITKHSPRQQGKQAGLRLSQNSCRAPLGPQACSLGPVRTLHPGPLHSAPCTLQHPHPHPSCTFAPFMPHDHQQNWFLPMTPLPSQLRPQPTTPSPALPPHSACHMTTRGGEGTLFPAHLKLVTFSGTFQIHGVLLTRIPWLPKPRDHELF